MKELNYQSYKAVQKALVDFGYTGLTFEEVKESTDKILNKTEKPFYVIDFFIEGFLRNSKLI